MPADAGSHVQRPDDLIVTHLIEVAFRGNRKEFFAWEGATPPPLKAAIIVEMDRGEDLGRVHSTGELADRRCRGCAHGCGTSAPARRALRLATDADLQVDRELTAENEKARRTAMVRVRANDLVMKLTDAEWQWDRRKLTFFFTADRRVDFRALVRDLASQFKTRIELRQIGVRDEAKRLSGVGRSGREYCSASWLSELRPVNLGVAKDQHLSLNPQQISGACGRLMCCLRYEHEYYVQSRRRFPREGRILNTARGEEMVISCDIFHDRVTLRTSEGDTRVVVLADLRAEVEGFEAMLLSATMDHRIPTAEMLDADTISMLDTQEYEVAVLAAPGLTRTPPPSPEAEIAGEVFSHGSPEHADTADNLSAETHVLRPEDPKKGAAADREAEPLVEPSSATPHRKRRRGRRGGRRLRAAEERRRIGMQSDPGTDSNIETSGQAEEVDDEAEGAD